MKFVLFILLITCLQLACAFTPSSMGVPSLRQSRPSALSATCALGGMDKAAKNVVSAAVVGAMLTTAPMFSDAATASNPYAKNTDPEPVKQTLTREEKEAKKGQNAAIIAVPLVGGLALSVPFFKRSLERMGEKAQGKR
eukprot:CAMPEP_0196730108 /NCGR_PEP_ID=MMETSP1091-20130531/10247_1 /TAXON_ID=302021 /ORGANISM="Rhodomonas sp., Strain CCMP768" /LENGTH=138 /DNA_ID=CAMNT_0042073055 /DNA_START=163 /DNA_END=579 /DNA_ORIENTATION=-